MLPQVWQRNRSNARAVRARIHPNNGLLPPWHSEREREAVLHDDLAVEQVDSASCTKRRTSASKRASSPRRGSKGNTGHRRWWRHSRWRSTPSRVEVSSAHLPAREDEGLGMRTYRGIPGFELVPPTKSIAPVRPPREELLLFSHSGYNQRNPSSTLRRHPPT